MILVYLSLQLGPGFVQVGPLFGLPIGGKIKYQHGSYSYEIGDNLNLDFGLQFAYLIPVTKNINVSANFYYGLAEHKFGEYDLISFKPKFSSLNFNVGYN